MANPKKFTFAGSTRHIRNIPDYANYGSSLEIEFDDPDDQYEAYEKDIPEPTPHPDGGTIKWFNAFGVRHKASKKDVDRNVVQYTVTLQRLPRGKKLYYLYKEKNQAQAQVYEVTAFEDVDDRRVRFPLDIGDPPNGVYP